MSETHTETTPESTSAAATKPTLTPGKKKPAPPNVVNAKDLVATRRTIERLFKHHSEAAKVWQNALRELQRLDSSVQRLAGGNGNTNVPLSDLDEENVEVPT